VLSVLFLCTGNSCRSQMAEGLARALHPELARFYSAGIETHGLNSRAQAVMAEIGIDISEHRSTTLEELGDPPLTHVFTVCSHAADNCPVFSGPARVQHVHFDDPPALTRGWTDEEGILEVYRRVRDEIRSFVTLLPERL